MGTKKLTYILSIALILIIVPLLVFNAIQDKKQSDEGRILATQPSKQTEPPKKKVPVVTATVKVVGPEEKGVILQGTKVEIKEGDTVLSSLLTAAKANGFSVEYTGSGTMAYIEGIAEIYEFDYGPTSGWLCYLNGQPLPKSSGTIKVKKGDLIEWKYTKDFGARS